jgi:hypothetical protein
MLVIDAFAILHALIMNTMQIRTFRVFTTAVSGTPFPSVTECCMLSKLLLFVVLPLCYIAGATAAAELVVLLQPLSGDKLTTTVQIC